MHKPETKFARGLKELHRDLMQRVHLYALSHVKVDNSLSALNSALKLHNIGPLYGTINNKATTPDIAAISRGMKQIDEVLEELKRDSTEIVEGIIAFNNLVLWCGEKFKHLFITFDGDAVEMFRHEHERLLNEKPGANAIRIKRKYTRRAAA